MTRAKVLHSHLGLALVVGLSAWTVSEIAHVGLIGPQGSVVALTVLLLGYLAAEIYRMRSVAPKRWLINPVTLCSIVTFIIGFGLGNLIYFYPENTLSDLGLTPEITPWMSKLMLLALMAAISMWLGYWSTAAGRISSWLSTRRWMARILRQEFNPRLGILPALALVSLASRLIQIRLGVFGYSADYERLVETASIRQYLAMTEGLGLLALVVASLNYYSPSPPVRAKAWFWGLLAYEVLFGFLSGFKSQVIMPFVVAGLCQYLRRTQIPWRWLALLPVGIVAAFAVIEPFRAARYGDSTFQGTSLENIAGTMVVAAAADNEVPLHDRQISTGLLLLKRTNTIYTASLGIEYADTQPLPEESPAFLADIFLAPLYAVIPRALWASKETTRHGVWYWNEVMRVDALDVKTSVGMSPFTYLYFAGGGLAVALGFFFLGIVQRVWADRLLAPNTAGALIVFLLSLHVLAIPDSIFYTIIVELIRVVPIALILQYVLFRR